MSRKVFLAGATGAIGRRLIPLLLKAGFEVYGTTRDAEKARDVERAGAQPVVVDVFDATTLRDLMAKVRPEIVIHELTDLPQTRTPESMAAAAERNARVRTEGTANLVAAALACSASRMLAQSIAFAYAPGPEPHDESDPLESPGRDSVIALEHLVMQSSPLEGIVLRYGSLYGPGTWHAKPDGDYPVHVDAAAWATLLALEHANAGVFNVAEESRYVSSAKARETLGWNPNFRL